MLSATRHPRPGAPPALAWQWEAETDILSGSVRPAAPGEPAEAIEVSSPDGAVIVLDVIGGELCGLDIVIWPDVETLSHLEPPPAEPGTVRLGGSAGPRQEETELTVRVDGPERTFHLRLGPSRDVSRTAVADHLIVELDADGAIAGFWLTGVPPFPSEE